jgi:hypothetical protein
VEDVVSGFTYILGSPGTRKLQLLLHEGLNRLQHLIRKPLTGVSESQAFEEERWAVGVAWTVVVIATPAFCRSFRGRELMRKRDDARKGVITIWKRRPRPGEAYPWRSSVDLDLPEQLDTQSVDTLIKQVSDKINYLEEVYSTNGLRGPVGRPGLFAMVSYPRKQDGLARLVRNQLEKEKITFWDYGASPRRQANYSAELAGRIKGSKVMIILLSQAWLQSEECQRESRQAADLHKRRIWLICDDTSPPKDADPADCFDFRPKHRKRTLQQLSHKVFPSRRQKPKPA